MSQQVSGVRGEQSGGSPLCTGTWLLSACHAKGLPIPSFAPGTVCIYPFVGICTWAGATEGRGPSWGLMHGESSQCGRSLPILIPRRLPVLLLSPACPQSQQEHQPPAHLSAPHRVIYRLCTGRQMVKENRAGGPVSRGLPVPRRGRRSRLLTASRVGGSEVVPVPGSTAALVMVQQPQTLEALGEPMGGPRPQEPSHKLQTCNHRILAMGH